MGTVVWRQDAFANDRVLEQQLRACLLAIRGVPAGRTVGDFKEALTRLGISDDLELASIRFGLDDDGTGELQVKATPMGVELVERLV